MLRSFEGVVEEFRGRSVAVMRTPTLFFAGLLFAAASCDTTPPPSDAGRADAAAAEDASVDAQGSRTTLRILGVNDFEGTGRIAAGAAGLTFGDEADTVNALVPELEAMGIETIVVLVHEGGAQSGGPSSCTGMAGAILDIVSRFDPSIDVVLTGHTHQAYVCEVDGHLVTSAGASGRLVRAPSSR